MSGKKLNKSMVRSDDTKSWSFRECHACRIYPGRPLKKVVEINTFLGDQEVAAISSHKSMQMLKR